MPDDVTFESPTTGKVQVVPPEHWNEALKMGYKPHSHKVMYSPQGKRGMVANENLREYMKKGYNTTLEVKAPPLPPTALDKAMALQKPVLVDVLSDPNVPPLPPHISFKQMKAFTSSIVKGDVDAWDMIKQTYKDVIENYLPHK